VQSPFIESKSTLSVGPYREHDLANMPSPFHVAVGFDGLIQRKPTIDVGTYLFSEERPYCVAKTVGDGNFTIHRKNTK